MEVLKYKHCYLSNLSSTSRIHICPVRSRDISETLLVNNEELRFSFLPTRGCSSGTFCNDTEDYPDLVFNLVRGLDDNHIIRDLFNHRARVPETSSKLNPKVTILSEETSATISPDDVLLRTTSQDFSPSLNPILEEPLCAERVDYHYPRKARTKHKEWRSEIEYVLYLNRSLHSGSL